MKNNYNTVVFVIILMFFSIVTLLIWYDVATIDRMLKKNITPVNYKPLEEAVSLWNKRKKFQMPKLDRATSSAEIGEKSEISQIYKVSIKNGSGVEKEALLLTDKFKNIEGIQITGVKNTKKTTYTTLSYKKNVEKNVIKKVSNVLNDAYGTFSITTLSDKAENDIEIIIGSETPLDR